MQRDEEAALMRKVASGDRVAFSVLVQAHQGALGAYAQRMMSDRDGANDIVQETFLRLWTRAASYKSESSRVTTWLHNIAHNLCIDGFRKNARIAPINVDDDAQTTERGPAELRDAQARSHDVRAALAALPERQRSALLMCHYQGLSNRDAAQILEVSVDALESLLARARRRLKQELNIDDYR